MTALALEVELLTGVYRGSRSTAEESADWPPQPDRLFSALVASWGARGEDAAERRSLEWLERQEPPGINASPCSMHTVPDVFVPPNDAPKENKNYGQILPARRSRKPRRFQAACPDNPMLRYVWQSVPEDEPMRRLADIARDVSYLGHSASLVRCQFVKVSDELAGSLQPARQRVYPGRLAELELAFRANPTRPSIRPGAPVRRQASPVAVRDDDWLVMEVVSSPRPDLRASAILCKLVRQALMSGYGRQHNAQVPEALSGHREDGRPTTVPHIAVVPMPFVGSEHATGAVFGFAVIPPTGQRLSDISGLFEAFKEVARYDPDRERRVLCLGSPSMEFCLELSPVVDDRLRSLSPGPYRDKARSWASVTPVVLDRHLKKKTDAEPRELIARACRNAGLLFPDPDRVQTGRHSAVPGAPSSRPHRGAPPWDRWQVPDAFRSRPLVHAVVEFPEPVQGPVLLGAGRFVGLGLMRAIAR